jgi:co-chaperonin GroES (HSP10)
VAAILNLEVMAKAEEKETAKGGIIIPDAAKEKPHDKKDTNFL